MQSNRLKRKMALLALLLAGFTYANAQTTNTFSVKQAVDYGLKNATQVKNALIDIQIQRQTNREITASAYPQLSASGNFNDYLKIPTSLLPGEVFGGAPGTFIPVQFGTKYTANGNVDLSQVLFDGQVLVGLQARKASIRLATLYAEVTSEQIKANIYKIYYQLVVGRKQVESIDANIERFDKLLKDTKEIFKQGFTERLEIDKVQVQLNNLQTEKVKIENQLEAGNAGLKFLLNMPQKDILVLTDTLGETELKENILEETYDYNLRKEFQVLNTTLKLNEYNIKRYRFSRIPSLSAFGSYQKNAQRTEFDFFGKGDWFTTSVIGLRLSVPLFDGNARRARIESAKLELRKTQNNLEQTRQSIDNDVAQSRINFKSALLTIDNQRRNIELAEKVYNSTKVKYEQGLGNNQEIYNAQAELKIAQNNYYGSLYDAINARIDYLKAVGRL